MNKKGALELNLKFLIGLAIGIIVLVLIFMPVFKNVLFFFKYLFEDEPACQDSKVYLDAVIQKIIKAKDNAGIEQEQIVGLQRGCAIVGFDKNGDYLTLKPDKCFQNACLCVCDIGEFSIGDNDCMTGAYCKTVEGIDGFIGNFDKDASKNEVFIKEGITNLKITYENKNIKIV